MRNPAVVIAVALVSAGIIMAGCGRQEASAPDPPAGPYYVSGVGTDTPVDVESARTLVDAALARSILGAVVSVPSRALTGTVAGPYVPRAKDAPPNVWWSYADGVTVNVWRFESETEAAYYAASEDQDPGIGPHITNVDVDGVEARVRERLDIDRVWDSAGHIVPGTGIQTGVAKIWWQSGDLVIEVMSGTADIASLMPVASAVKATR